MILAAGRGERARPLSDSIPKPLFPVNGYPLISYPLGLLKGFGVTDVVVNVHHLADQIEETLDHVQGLTIHISREPSLLETGGGLAKARSLVGNEPFLLLNGDVICDVDLDAVLADHSDAGAVATMVLRDQQEDGTYAPVAFEPHTRLVKDLRGDIGYHSETSVPMLFTGVHVLEPTVFEYLFPMKESIVDAFYLPAIREGLRVNGFVADRYWADLGTMETHRRVSEEIAGIDLRFAKPLPLPVRDVPLAES